MSGRPTSSVLVELRGERARLLLEVKAARAAALHAADGHLADLDRQHERVVRALRESAAADAAQLRDDADVQVAAIRRTISVLRRGHERTGVDGGS